MSDDESTKPDLKINLDERIPVGELHVVQGGEERRLVADAYYGRHIQGDPAKEIPKIELRSSDPLTFDEFMKVDLRVGTVTAAERVPKSEKLIRMDVSFGNFKRQILAGVGRTFQPEALVGKQFVFVVNLPPRKMMGLESHGMALATGKFDALVLISPSAPVADGSRFG